MYSSTILQEELFFKIASQISTLEADSCSWVWMVCLQESTFAGSLSLIALKADL